MRDLRHAARRLVRTPGFTLASIVTLALGIGAVTAVFSVVHSIVMRPLPYPESDRILWLDHAGPGIGTEQGLGMTRGLYVHYREGLTTFERMASWTPFDVTLAGANPERLKAVVTTPELFATLGAAPAVGRGLEGAAASETGTVVISHRLAIRRSGLASDALGQALRANGSPLEVVGVMPAGFAFPNAEIDLWIPVPIDQATRLGGFSWSGIGRLAPAATRASAEAEARTVIPGLRDRFGVGRMLDDTRLEPRFLPLRDHIVAEAERTLWILFGSVVFVLLLACANVANLLLVRAEGRQREVALRRTLGAGRREILRYHLSEGALLALAGGALGVIVAAAGVQLLTTLGPADLPRLAEVSVSPPVLGFAGLIALGASLVFALIPALRSTPSLAATVKSGARGASAGPARGVGRRAFVVTQMALALMLLVATGLMSRSFVHLVQYDPGFDAENRLTFRVGLSPASYPDDRSAAAFHREALNRLAGVPGVDVVGATSCLPLCERWGGTQLTVDGRPDDPSTVPRVVAIRRVNEGLFEALGVRLVAGQLPDRIDHEGESGAAVISRELAEAYWPDEDPLGARFQPGSGGDDWYTVAGIVEDTPINGFGGDPPPIAYLPLVYGSDTSNSPFELSYVLRTSVHPQTTLTQVREVLRSVDPEVPISEVSTLEQIVAGANVQTAFTTVMLGGAAGIALLLGAIGIYGVISYTVGRRTREIGIRLALGARAEQVTRRILLDESRTTALGVVIGLAGAFALTRVMHTLLFGVSPTDPISFVSAAVLLAGVALLATYVPARRSAAVDPARTLRAD